jgi:hypothetical protein
MLGVGLLGAHLLPRTIITNPTRVAAVSAQIARYQLPDGFKEMFASDLLGFKLVAIGPADPRAELLVIMLLQLPELMETDEEELRQQLEKALAQQAGTGDAEMQVVGTQRVTIRGQEVLLTMREGTASGGQLLRQLSGVFSGANGPVFLFITGLQSAWDAPLINRFIASIE